MSSTLQPGSSLSHYRVISPLGAGGMGEVYMAQDETLDRAVALKVLPPELVKSEERVRRFIQEAKSASSLSHPHIVTIYEIGKAEARSGETADGAAPSSTIHFIAMELISGETLKQKMHGEKTDLKTLLRYLSQAAEGLAKAHAAGIVHRDLKPENIMISRDGYAKVLDFGLAKLTERRESGDPNNELTATRDQTREGAVMGTVAYMSPEQVQGRTVDHRSDIFSFGSILYEAATRSKPFMADSDLEVMHKILRDKPAPIEERNPEVPAELRRLIRRCMAKSPDQRLQSMKDLAIELGEIAEEFDELSASATSHGSGSASSAGAVAPVATGAGVRWPLIAVGLLGLVGIGFGVYSWMRGHAAAGAAPSSFQSMQLTRLTTSGKVPLGALSPDGKYLANVVKDTKGYSLWVRQVATGSDVQVAQSVSTPFRGITFSPDGNYLYYVNQEHDGPGYSTLYQIPVLGGTARKILFDIDTAVSFSPDGKRIAFMRGYPNDKVNVLMVADADGKNERKLATRKEPENFAIVAPSWSTTGNRLAAVIGSARGGNHGEMEIVDAESGKESPLGTSRWWNLSSVAWMPDGSGLLLTGFPEKSEPRNQVWFLGYPGGQPRKITNDLNVYDGASVTSDSKSLTTAQTNQIANLYAAPANDSRSPAQITFGSGGEDAITSFAVASDGIVFVAQQGSQVKIWSMALDGSRRFQISPEAGLDVAVRMSGDRPIVLFAGFRDDGLSHLWKMNRDGSNPVQITHGTGEMPVALSPDGRSALYRDLVSGSLMRIPIDGGNPQKLADQFLGEAAVSSDGKRIAHDSFVRQGDLFRRQIVLARAEDGQPSGPMIPWPEGNGLQWSPAGDALTYIKEIEGVGNLWSQPLDGSPARQLTRFPSLQLFSYAWSPDGKQIYFSRGQTTSDMVLIRDFH